MGLDRAYHLASAAVAASMLVVGRSLTPSPSGVGTHRQLGFPPCFFLHLTGWPCPNCGLTTSFSYAAHLHFKAALLAQPFGLLVFLIAASSIPVSILLAVRNEPWERVIHSPSSNRIMYLLIAFYLASWAYKIASMRFYSAIHN